MPDQLIHHAPALGCDLPDPQDIVRPCRDPRPRRCNIHDLGLQNRRGDVHHFVLPPNPPSPVPLAAELGNGDVVGRRADPGEVRLQVPEDQVIIRGGSTNYTVLRVEPDGEATHAGVAPALYSGRLVLGPLALSWYGFLHRRRQQQLERGPLQCLQTVASGAIERSDSSIPLLTSENHVQLRHVCGLHHTLVVHAQIVPF
mmetsp:Transcript_29442/g.75421  ORF Transcript_29442/g.75421 Transcript_29442/m.75421 type:complete len:200 (+) Transcript_29442:3119-3718(+)